MIISFDGKSPDVDDSAFVAENTLISGDVKIGAGASIWFGTVIRGDMNSISVGRRTNIQDLCLLHVPDETGLRIGTDVTIGHRAIVHGCKIGNNCLIGMGSIIMDDVEIGDNCIIGAGSLLTQGVKIPPGTIVFGSPAKVKRDVTPEEIDLIADSAKKYYDLSRKYMK